MTPERLIELYYRMIEAMIGSSITRPKDLVQRWWAWKDSRYGTMSMFDR